MFNKYQYFYQVYKKKKKNRKKNEKIKIKKFVLTIKRGMERKKVTFDGEMKKLKLKLFQMYIQIER